MKKEKISMLDPSQLSQNIRPQDDFFSYVNKKWVDVNPIPDSETRWGTFNVLRDDAWKNMRNIYEDLQDGEYEKSSIQQQAKDFYFTGVHYNDFEKIHLETIENYLNKIEAVKNINELVLLIADLHTIGLNDPWVIYVDANEKDSTKHILRFRQSGLTLPNRDYYLEENEKMQKIRDEYKSHGAVVHKHFPSITTKNLNFWESIWSSEYALANISRSKVDLRDVENNFNVMSIDEINKKYPNLFIKGYLKKLNAPEVDIASIDQPEFFEYLNNHFTDDYLDIWKTYMKWQIVMSFYGYISDKFTDLKFDFFGKVLSGTKEKMPLWKRIVLILDDAIGEGAGKLYAEKHFPESSKQEVLKLVENVRDAYEERINQLDWMSDTTKAYAIKKLRNIKVLIGYPDKWRDYSKLSIGRSSLLENIISAEVFDTEYSLNKLKESVSRDEWFMDPQTVNAYHDPNRLVICFPAAILQKPFFSPEAHIAENMGGIGSVIAHEFTHGFDDQGCQFDAEGNLRTWQTEEERKAFMDKAQIIIDQADKHEVIPGVFLKGKLVIGESIADLGGIEISYHALKTKLEDKLNEELTTGLTAGEAFFYSYAQTECGSTREEKAREFAMTDPHPDSVFRVNAIVQHSDDWHDKFNVSEKDKLYRAPEDRAKIW